MAKPITWVGIDDDKMNLTVAVLRGSRQKHADVRRIPNEDRALRRWVRRLVREADGGEIRMYYEAGPNGFALMRRIEAMGPVVVEVVAPSLTPRRSGQRVKTDPIDARKLAHLYRAGELRAISVPGEDSESSRDLVRTYHRVGEEATRKRHHILKFLIRRGRIYRDGAHWTGKHWSWLRAQQFESWKDTVIFEELLAGLGELEARRQRLTGSPEKLGSSSGRCRSQTASTRSTRVGDRDRGSCSSPTPQTLLGTADARKASREGDDGGGPRAGRVCVGGFDRVPAAIPPQGCVGSRNKIRRTRSGAGTIWRSPIELCDRDSFPSPRC